MAVYKEEKTNTWRAVYRYTDWNGERKQTQKRGFKTKREAQTWEREQLNKRSADLDMSFKSFVDLYTKDLKTRLKENTWATKDHIIRTKLLPYFGKLKMCNITAQQIITWQNEMLRHKDEQGKPYSPVYLKTVHNQLSAIFNHAVRYYILQDDYFNAMREAGYTDVERGERGSTEEHLTVTQFKVEREQERLANLTEQTQQREKQVATLEKKIEKIQKQQTDIQTVEQIVPRPVPLTSKVMLDRDVYERLAAAAKKYIVQERKESKLQKALDAALKLIEELKEKVAALTAELSSYKSIRSRFDVTNLRHENEVLRSKVRRYESVIERNGLWHLFGTRRGKETAKEEVR